MGSASSSSPEKMTLRKVSRRRRFNDGVIVLVVYGCVGMNFIPSPRMDLAAWGMMLPWVRSWNAKFSMVGDMLVVGVIARMDMAFWRGDWLGFGRKPYLALIIFSACCDVWVFAPLSICNSDWILLWTGMFLSLRWRW